MRTRLLIATSGATHDKSAWYAAQIFEGCFKGDPLSDSKNEAQCRLTQDYGGAYALKFKLALRVYTPVWSMNFRFVIKLVPLEAVQIPNAVNQDLREELAQTRYLLNVATDRLRHSKLLLLECDLSNRDGVTSRGSSVLRWKRAWRSIEDKSGHIVLGTSSAIRIHCPSSYWISATLHHDEQDVGLRHIVLKQSNRGSSRLTKEFPITCYSSCSTQLCLIVITQDQEVTVVRTTKGVVLDDASALAIVRFN